MLGKIEEYSNGSYAEFEHKDSDINEMNLFKKFCSKLNI